VCASARVVGANRRQLFHSCTHALTARASFLTRSQGARIGARGGLGATASTARRRGGGAARTTGSAKPRERGRPRGSTTAAAAMRRDAGDDDRARVDRREVRSKAMRYRSRVRFNRYRSIDRSVTGFSSGRRGPFMNGRCVPRGGESPFSRGRSRCGCGLRGAGSSGADAGSYDDDDDDDDDDDACA